MTTTRTSPRARRALSVLGVVVVTALSLSLPSGAEPSISSPRALPGGAGAAVKGVAPFGSMSCPDATDCTAVGAVDSSTVGTTASAVTASSGTWSTAVAISSPAGAATAATFKGASLADIDCWSVGDCVAVGNYLISSKLGSIAYPTSTPMVAVETGGTWAAATEVPLVTTGYTEGDVDSVSCDASGDCTALGWYVVVNSNVTVFTYHSFVTTEAAGSGTWTTPTLLPDPSGTSPEIGSNSISCADATDCTAIQPVVAGSGKSETVKSYVISDVAGTWGAWVALTPAGTAPFAAEAITCPDATDCVAVGYDAPTVNDVLNGIASSSAAAIETAGVWAAATTLPTPKLSPLVSETQLNAVSCWTVGGCEAVGAGLVAPKDLTIVSLAVTDAAGVWSSTSLVAAPVPAGKSTATLSALSSVDCLSSTECLALGRSATGSIQSNTPEYSFDTDIAPIAVVTVPGRVGGVKVTGTTTKMTIGFSPPTRDGGAPITSFTVTARSKGEPTRTCTTSVESCSIAKPVQKHVYSVTVTAHNAAGNSVASVAVSFKQP